MWRFGWTSLISWWQWMMKRKLHSTSDNAIGRVQLWDEFGTHYIEVHGWYLVKRPNRDLDHELDTDATELHAEAQFQSNILIFYYNSLILGIFNITQLTARILASTCWVPYYSNNTDLHMLNFVLHLLIPTEVWFKYAKSNYAADDERMTQIIYCTYI